MKSYHQFGSTVLSASILIARRFARSSSVILAIFAFWAASTSPGAAEELLTNGNFETGDLSGWTVLDEGCGDGTYYISSPGDKSPASGHPTADNPLGGDYYAVSDENHPGSHILYQSFDVPAGTTSLTLTFQMFANNLSGVVDTPDTLDFKGDPNQQVRVDILDSMASPFTVGSAVVDNIYDSEDSGPNPDPFQYYTVDLSDLDNAPGTYYLRFAEVDNQFYNQNGIDNVSICADPAVPEPSTWDLFLGGLGGVVLLHRLRRKTAAMPETVAA